MSIENQRNRDLHLKICFMYYITYILKILGIDEEIEDILPTEIITMETIGMPKIFDNFLDFRVLTKSGKILIFEFKKNPLTTKDLKQAYEYYDRVHCKNNANVKLIIIVISDRGKIVQYSKSDITYHPQIIKTKKINKQKDLSILRDKLESDEKLTPYDCSLLIALPLFDLEESEAEIVEEMCVNLQEKKHCFEEDELDKVTLAMYLNIIEYIDEDKQKDLMEMIDVAAKLEGELAKIRKTAMKRGMEKGIKKGKKDIINGLLKKYTPEELSKILDMEKATLISIVHE